MRLDRGYEKIAQSTSLSEVDDFLRPRLGCVRRGDSDFEFTVWAPFLDSVQLHCVSPQELLVPLTRNDRGYFHAYVSNLPLETRYFYRLNGKVDRPDPASRLQLEGVHGPSSFVGTDFAWSDHDWSGLQQQDYIFYEIHVGVYTEGGTFDDIHEHLRGLKELGITALEIMPVAQCPGTRNWGYDGVYPFAVTTAYGGPYGLKRLVNASHEVGLAVVLDVVYNHLGPEGNYLSQFGPYFTDRYHTPWGEAINFDGPQSDEVVRYFVENALQWLDEFHIDALRLDAVHGIVDRNAQPFLSILSQEVEELGRRTGRKIHLIAESDANDPRYVMPRSNGGLGLDAQWSDDFHHALHSLQTGERDGYYADFGQPDQLAKAFSSGFVFDGQYSAYRERRQGSSPRDLQGQQFVICSQNHDQVGNRMLGERSSTLLDFEALKLSAATVLLSPYLPLLFMGEEFGEIAPFLYFTSHTDPALAEAVRRGRKEEFAAFSWQGEPPDPQSEKTLETSKVKHDLATREPHRSLRAFYQELIRLRKIVPALRNLNKEHVDASTTESTRLLLIRRWHNSDQALLLLNFADTSVTPARAILSETWTKVLDSADTKWKGPGTSIPAVVDAHSEEWALAPRSACVFRRGDRT
jgi:maltooligosyltrehalose trehalohydrolase